MTEWEPLQAKVGYQGPLAASVDWGDTLLAKIEWGGPEMFFYRPSKFNNMAVQQKYRKRMVL